MKITSMAPSALTALRTLPRLPESASASSSALSSTMDTAGLSAASTRTEVTNITDVMRQGQNASMIAANTQQDLTRIDAALDRMQSITDQAFDQPSLYAAEMAALRDTLDHLAIQRTLDGSTPSLSVGNSNIKFVTSALDSRSLGLGSLSNNATRDSITQAITAARAVVAHQSQNVKAAAASIASELDAYAQRLTAAVPQRSGISANSMLMDASLAATAATELHSLMMANSSMAVVSQRNLRLTGF